MCARALTSFWLIMQLMLVGLSAQKPGDRFKHFIETDGYPLSGIQAMEQTRDGYLWLAGSQGVYRYDGLRFQKQEIFPPGYAVQGSDYVFDLQEDPDSNWLWIATTNDGIVRFDYEKNISRVSNPKEFFPDRIVNNLTRQFGLDLYGNVWAVTHDGLIKIQNGGDSLALYQITQDLDRDFPDPYVNRLSAFVQLEPGNQVWVSGLRGLYLLNLDSGEFLRTPLFPASPTFHPILTAMQPNQGKLMIGTWEDGLIEFDPAQGDGKQFKFLKTYGVPVVQGQVKDIVARNPTTFWICSPQGLYLFDDSSEEFLQFPMTLSELQTPNLEKCNTALRDNDGTLWVGHEAGLSKLDRSNNMFQYRYVSRIFDNAQGAYLTSAIPVANDTVAWCLSSGRAITMAKETDTFAETDVPAFPGTENGIYELIRYGAEEMLILTPESFLRHNLTTQSTQTLLADTAFEASGLRLMLSHAIDTARHILWYGLQWGRGLGMLDLASGESQIFRQREFLPDSSITPGGFESVLLHSSGDLWFTMHTGLFQYQPDENRFTHFAYDPHNPAGLPNPTCVGLTEDHDGFIWVSTPGGGLCRINPGLGPQQDMLLMNESSGLPENHLGFLTTDHAGFLWVTSTTGIQRIDPRSKAILQFSTVHGLPKNQLFPYRFVDLGQDLLGVLMIDGFIWFNPDAVVDTSRSNPIVISAVDIFGEENRFTGNADFLESVRLDYKQRRISIEFALLNFQEPNLNQYAYMLDDFDPDWVYCRNETLARYTNIPPGTYRFRVKASANGMHWREREKMLLISVRAPFWQAWWFYLACGIVVFAIIWSVNRYQVAQVKKEERLKTEFNKKLAQVEMEALRSQMNPHFLFNALNSIKHFILSNDKFTAAEYLSSFSRLVRKILNNSKSARIPIEEEVETLKLYLAMEKMRFEEKFDFTVTVAENVRALQMNIPPLILQPYVENAIWHGLMHKEEKGHVSIDLRVEDEVLLCKIEDDGIGREAAAQIRSKSAIKKKSFGMKITRARIDMTAENASVKIQDLTDPAGHAAGTCVEIRIPITKIE